MTENTSSSWLARPRVRRGLKRSGIGIAALFLIYVIGGFIGVPLIIKHVVIAKVDKQLVGSLETGSVRFNPFSWVLEIHDFKGYTSEGDVAASFSKFRLNLQPSTVFADEMVVREVLLDQAKGIVCVNEHGELNLVSLFGLEKAKSNNPKAEPFVIPPLVIETLRVRDAGLELRLESFDQAFERKLQDISFVMNDVRSHSTHDNSYELMVVSESGEKIAIKGSLRLDPLSSTGSIQLADIHLPDFSTFTSSLLDARISSGAMNASLDYRFQPLASQPEFGIFNGQLLLLDFGLHEESKENQEQAIQRIDFLHVDDFFLDITRRKAGMESIEIRSALLGIVRDADGLRFAGLKKPKAITGSPTNAAEQAANGKEIITGVISNDQDIGEALTKALQSLKLLGGGDKGSGPSPLAIRIGKIKTSKAQLALVDQAIQPSTKISLTDIRLNAGPYLSEGSEPMALDLSAALAGKDSGKIKLGGEVSAHDFHQSTRLEVELDQLSMATFASYVAPAIGRAPNQGTLTADMTYTIRSGILEGSNELTLLDMKLGAQDESPDAPKLPLDLAIAILEDTHGTIEIDLPVKGDLSHPKFSFDRIISRAIANVVTKVATAPFRMLGNLLPDGQDFDEDFIAFEPGESQLTGKDSKMVEAIAKVMEARPRIGVELRGCYATEQDGKALAEQRFQNQLAELTDKGESRKDAIKRLYKDLPKDQKESGWLLPKPEVMEANVRKAIKITKEDLKALANQRVKGVLTALKEAKIDEDRIALKRPETADSPRIELNFDVRS